MPKLRFQRTRTRQRKHVEGWFSVRVLVQEFVLNKIQDVEDFNTRLQDLMLHRMESFLQTSRASTAADLFDEVVLAVVNVAI